MFPPEIERLTFLCGIARPIVDAGTAGLMSADMVEHSLDDVRLHAEFGHAGRDRAPYVMQPPWADRGRLLVEYGLAVRPALKTARLGFARVVTEYQVLLIRTRGPIGAVRWT